ncbi:hypothetical protein FUA23_09380 [Neolewinella aurantiaca]|uniref:Phosphate-selective porin O/P n=1 Tax=Neolewinella aurantiaca TaxID=2602767 RepID=A0A5C7FIM6_9BACT|nr:hypothetical protein [Neolewinella aurantiaca]TXF89651.1 hypothetical protein FUA23_09380 [Neolewinella aurantiaca]
MSKYLMLLCLLMISASLSARRDSSRLNQLLADYRIKISVGLQLWSTYSRGMEMYDMEQGAYTSLEDRLNVQLRRSRFSVSGQPYPTLRFKVTSSLDLVGHDVLAATEAGGNNGSSPEFRIWNAFVNWQLAPAKDVLYATAGYYVSPIGRESNTSAMRSISFEKAWSQNYLRRHLIGTGPGRAMGLMLSGQLHNSNGKRHLTYELSLQNPIFDTLSGNSSGSNYSPLLSARLSLHAGDPENKSYSLGHKVNYFGKRNGLTISLSAARQGKSAGFSANGAYGLEYLYNSQVVHLDGEFFFLSRSDDRLPGHARFEGRTGYFRIGKNIPLPRALTMEPVVSYWFFDGPLEAADILEATSLGSFTGSDTGLDIGANLYFSPNHKLSLFYAFRMGDAGEGKHELIENNYFQQSGVGAVRRGNYFGGGWVVIF